MKRKIIPLLMISLILTGCSSKAFASNPIVVQQAKVEETECKESEKTLYEVYDQVIKGKTTYYDEDNGATTITQDGINRTDDLIAKPSKVAAVDFDGDGIMEYVVLLDLYQPESKEPFDGEYLVLHYYDGIVYGYHHVFRGMEQLNTNGTYIGSSGASDNQKLTLSFDKEKEIETVLASSVSDYTGEVASVKYYIGKKEVAEDEFNQYIKILSPKEVTWYDYADASWMKLFL